MFIPPSPWMVSKKTALISLLDCAISSIHFISFSGERTKPSNNGPKPFCIKGLEEAEIVAIDLP